MIYETLFAGLLLFCWLLYTALTLIFSSAKHKILSYIILFLYVLWFIYRISLTSFAPFSNIYESLILFGFLFALKIKISENEGYKLTGVLSIFGSILVAISLLLPLHDKMPSATLAPLISPWIYIHVPLIFLGYISLVVAFVLSILIYFKKFQKVSLLTHQIKQTIFFMAAGIISGAFWADQSWGIFWSWDPKETSALFTWIFVVIALHVKNPNKKMLILILAFVVMLFTYFGVTFLLNGLHSYL